MKNNPFAGKSTRTKIFAVISVVAILLLMVLNIWLAKFTLFGNAYIDLTPEGLYTLSPEMEKACENVFYMSDGTLRDPGIKITFCNDPDNLMDSISTRVVYYMAVAMSKRFDNCTVETVNVNINPTAVAQYKTTSLTRITSRDLIISYGSRYRIVSVDNFWRVMSDNTVYSYDGEYKMMSYMLSLTLVDRPTAYFVTDHGETYYTENPVTDTEKEMNGETGVFVDLLHDRGFDVKNLSISKLIEDAEKASAELGKNVIPEIPEDCVLLIINNPKEDFRYDPNKATSLAYVSETEILDRYMTDERGSIMVSVDYDSVGINEKTLGNLEDFLAEWGIACTGLKVTDDTNSVANADGDDSTLVIDYELDENSYAYQIYGDFAAMTSSPRFIVGNTGSLKTAFGIGHSANEPGSSKTMRVFTPFLYSYNTAKGYAKNELSGTYTDLASEGQQIVAALGSRQTTDSDDGTETFSYVFCSASPDFFSSTSLGNTSYANFDIVSALVQNICRLDTFADDSLGGEGFNSSKFLGKTLVDTTVRAEDTSEKYYTDDGKEEIDVKYGLTDSRRNWIIVIVSILPVAISAVGIVVCVKRKYL